MIAVASVLVGLAVGLRFNVLVIIPINAVAAIFAAVAAAAHGSQGWAIILASLVSVVGLQIGYLCASYSRAVYSAAYAPEPMMSGSPQKSEIEYGAQTR